MLAASPLEQGEDPPSGNVRRRLTGSTFYAVDTLTGGWRQALSEATIKKYAELDSEAAYVELLSKVDHLAGDGICDELEGLLLTSDDFSYWH